MLTLIAARARDGAIGRDGTIPWHAPEDLRQFQRETLGGALIMGRRTWLSLPTRPLPRRLNVVVSRDATLADHVAPDIDTALTICTSEGYSRLYGIGGTAIYAALLPHAHRLLLTEVDTDIPDADAHFPAFDDAHWREIHRRSLPGPLPMTLRELLRRA